MAEVLDPGLGRSRVVMRSMEVGRWKKNFMSLFLTQGGMNCGVVDGLQLDYFLHNKLGASLPMTLIHHENWQTI